jgi:hypothetical protein
MNLDSVKNKLNQLQNKGKGGEKKEKIDYSLIYWKAQPGKHTVRIVPSKFNKDLPFQEVYFHYNLTKAPIMALTNFGESDPVVEFSKVLKKSDDKTDWATAKKLYPKMRIFVPVVVRGEEEKGVRLWEFGKTVYQELLSMGDDDDIGDFTDIVEGRDITVTRVSAEEEGSLYGSISIRPKTKITKLSDNKDTVKAWLENQPDIFSLYKRYNFEDLKDVLQKWLTPDETSEDEAVAEVEVTPAPTKYALKPTKAKADEFDALFKEPNLAI